MALLVCDSDSDDLPDLNDIISRHLKLQSVQSLQPSANGHNQSLPTSERQKSPAKATTKVQIDAISRHTLLRTLSPRLDRNGKIRTRKAVGTQAPLPLKEAIQRLQPLTDQTSPRKTPARHVKQVKQLEVCRRESISISDASDQDQTTWCEQDTSASISDSESDSDASLPSINGRVWSPSRRLIQTKTCTTRPTVLAHSQRCEPAIDRQKLEVAETISDKENDNFTTLRFSPPRLQKIPDSAYQNRPSTPPLQSPTKTRLASPSKTKRRIPTPPHRPSIDVFWDAEHVNDWNDQYSPQKPLLSPSKNRFISDDFGTPTIISPVKGQSSPFKRTKNQLQAIRSFNDSKTAVAEAFLSELDAKITDGQIGALSASTGGVKLVWSKTLNSTAGRANWKRETTKRRSDDGVSEAIYKHHATIELAEKVIDDEVRLINVLAHEFCHLANFMISGIKDQPHGKQFKVWGRKVSAAFADRQVLVTTKHDYQIEYKYIWACTNEICGAEFKRHSRSIDPTKSRCGACKGSLAQIKPVPRKAAGPEGTKGEKLVGGYAGFVKDHFAAMKKDMLGASHKEVMTALGQKYREQKEAAVTVQAIASHRDGAADIDVDGMAKALEIIDLDA